MGGRDARERRVRAALLAAGLERSTLEAWLDTNPVVTLEGKTDKVFDLTEEMSAAEVLRAVASR